VLSPSQAKHLFAASDPAVEQPTSCLRAITCADLRRCVTAIYWGQVVGRFNPLSTTEEISFGLHSAGIRPKDLREMTTMRSVVADTLGEPSEVLHLLQTPNT
jgi:hypothetical protein